jgi:hypothetical protein
LYFYSQKAFKTVEKRGILWYNENGQNLLRRQTGCRAASAFPTAKPDRAGPGDRLAA